MLRFLFKKKFAKPDAWQNKGYEVVVVFDNTVCLFFLMEFQLYNTILRISIVLWFVPFKFKQILKSERDIGLPFFRQPHFGQVDPFRYSENV